LSSAERQPLENPPELGVQGLARYVADAQIPAESYGAAHACLLGALANALSALRRPECLRLAGPVVPGATMVHGARLPGTSIELDPVAAAFGLAVSATMLATSIAFYEVITKVSHWKRIVAVPDVQKFIEQRTVRKRA